MTAYHSKPNRLTNSTRYHLALPVVQKTEHEMSSPLTFNLGEDDRARRVLGWRRLPSPETKTDYEPDREPTQLGFAVIAENLQCGCTGIGVCEIRDVNYGEGGSKEMTGVPYICTAPVSDRRCLSERWHKPTDEIEQKQYIPNAKVLVYFKKLTRSAGCIPRSAQSRLRLRASEFPKNFNLCEEHPSLRSFWDFADAIDHSFADPDNSQALLWAAPPVHVNGPRLDPLIASFLSFNPGMALIRKISPTTKKAKKIKVLKPKPE